MILIESGKITNHSLTPDIHVFSADNEKTLDATHYIKKVYSQSNEMISMRYGIDRLIEETDKLRENDIDGYLLPIVSVKENNGNIEVVYAYPANQWFQETIYTYIKPQNRLNNMVFGQELTIKLVLQICEAVRVLHNIGPQFSLRFLNPDCILVDGKTRNIKLINYEIQVNPDIFNLDSYNKEQLFFVDPGLYKKRNTENENPRESDHDSDIYSIGCILFYMLTNSTTGLKKKSPRINKNLQKIINKCVSDTDNIKKRYMDIDDLIEDLTEQLKLCDAEQPSFEFIPNRKAEKRIAAAINNISTKSTKSTKSTTPTKSTKPPKSTKKGAGKNMFKNILNVGLNWRSALRMLVTITVPPLIIFFSISAIALLKQPQTEVDALLMEARYYRDNGYFVLSEQKYIEYIGNNSQNADGYIGYAQLLMENGLLEKADNNLNLLNENALKSKQKSEYYLLKGKIQDELGNYYPAITNYRRAYDIYKNNVVNGVVLVASNIKAPQRTEALDKEYDTVLSNLENLTKDKSVINYIDACQAYETEDYQTAYELFVECTKSNSEYIKNEAFYYLMELTTKIESDQLQALSLQKDILQMAEEADCVTLITLFMKESYAISLYEYATSSEQIDEQEKLAMIQEAKEHFKFLYGRINNRPNVYVYYAEILRSEHKYDIAREVMNIADSMVGDNILILIGRIYAEYDYQKNSDSTSPNKYAEIKKMYNRVKELYIKEAAYESEMVKLEEFIDQVIKAEIIPGFA